MAKKDNAPRGCSKEKYKMMLDFARKGLFQEYTTETGEIVRTGHPRKIDTLDTFRRAVNDYIEYLEYMNNKRPEGEKPFFPTVISFCLFCGMGKDTYYRVTRNPSNPRDYCEEVKGFESFILSALQQLGLSGEAATIPYMAEINNFHGYTNAPQVVQHEITTKLPTVDEIRNRLPGFDQD